MPRTKTTTPPESRRFIRQETAAERWDVSVDTIRRLIRSGKITGYRLNNRIIRVDVAEVDAAFRLIPTVSAAR
ncbi:helix-turn-helix domain-containing protein [Tessaracoccus sp. Z1128]